MMKLTTMGKVVATGSNDGTTPLAEACLGPFGCDAGSMRFVRASANFVCVFRKDGRQHFLRFSDASERTHEAIDAEVRLVAWLDAQGVPVAAPVPSAHGRLVETIDSSLGRFHAVVFVGLEGNHVETSDCEEVQFSAWGAALGRLHAVMKRYRHPTTVNRPSWRDHLTLAMPYVDGDPILQTEWARLNQWAASLPDDAANFGLIHYDFEADNLCWHNGKIGMLDFDDCAHHWYAADIAYALRDLFKEGADVSHPMIQAFVTGYAAQHPLSEELLAQLPMFLRLHGMYMYGRLSRALDLPRDQEPPAWLKRLETKLSQVLADYRKSLTPNSVAIPAASKTTSHP